MNEELRKYIDIIKLNSEELKNKYKIKFLAIFGSVVWGVQTKDSDIDILVEFSEPIRLSHFLSTEEYLSNILGCKVDLVQKGAMKPHIEKQAEKEMEVVICENAVRMTSKERGGYMNKRNRIKDYLNDIIECCDRIEKYTENISFQEYINNSLIKDSVERNLIKIGDIIERIPKDFQDEYNQIPWTEIKGMRNVLTHHYNRIVDEIVWETVKKDIPELRNKLKQIIETIEKNET